MCEYGDVTKPNTMTTTLEETIAQAKETKAAHGYTITAAVYKLWTSKRRWQWGWNFQQNVEVGQMVNGDYGYRFEIMAIV